MEYTINEEFAKENGLSTDQVAALTGNVTEFHTNALANEKLAWDGKANTDAEAIINGAISSTQKTFNVELGRNEGEKHMDYLVRLNKTILGDSQTNVNKLKADYEEKLKNFDGSESLKADLDAAKEKLNGTLEKYADYDTLKERAGLVDGLTSENSELTKNVTFGAVKPSFPEGVNKYEAKAVWEEWIASIEKEWDVKLVDKVPTAINKENPFKTEKLEVLLSKNETVSALLVGRNQNGLDGKEKDLRKLEGVPFAVPVAADSKDLVKLIKEQIQKEGIPTISDAYSARFKELNEAITKQKTA